MDAVSAPWTTLSTVAVWYIGSLRMRARTATCQRAWRLGGRARRAARRASNSSPQHMVQYENCDSLARASASAFSSSVVMILGCWRTKRAASLRRDRDTTEQGRFG